MKRFLFPASGYPCRLAVISGFLLLSMTAWLGAQSNTGRLIGTVVDAQGGVIPGASITIVDI